MSELDRIAESENEHFPVEPRYHPVHKIPRKIYDFLASSKLAMFLLVAILACCITGVTVFREKRAWDLIFSTLWFNALLVLLVINVACCFFGRIWHRKLTVVSFGMILFHLSFVAMFGAIVYDSLFFFEGSMRLTEGETLVNGSLESYDTYRQGRFFKFTQLTGETTLVKMHKGYRVDGDDKRAAYELEVGEPGAKKKSIVYIGHNLDYNGFKFLPEKEGYSTAVYLYDKEGANLYGAHVPLQSYRQQDKSFMYSTGEKASPGVFPYPQGAADPLFYLQVVYRPSPVTERGGEAYFQVWPYGKTNARPEDKPLATGKGAIGEKVAAGDHFLSVNEIRYWVGMNVRHNPAKPVILGSLWVGLAGMIITTFGRMKQGGCAAKGA